MPFTEATLCAALQKAPIQKAVAPGTMPNLLLRVLAPELAAWLWPSLGAMWCSTTPSIPQSWKDAWLCLLAKRAVKSANDTRPIALTDGLGKVILS